jgi:hypothetical protein
MTCYGGPKSINEPLSVDALPPPKPYSAPSWFSKSNVFTRSNGLGALNTIWSPKGRRMLQKPAALPEEDTQLLEAFGELVGAIKTQGTDCPVNERGAVSPAPGENEPVQVTGFDEAPHLDSPTYCNFMSLPSIMKVLSFRACVCCCSAAALCVCPPSRLMAKCVRRVCFRSLFTNALSGPAENTSIQTSF